MNESKNEILVLPSSPGQAKGAKGLFDTVTAPVGMDVDQLRDNVTSFLNSVNGLLSSVPMESGSFKLDEVELTVEVSAEGSIQLIGGIKTGASGGITFRMKR